VLIIDDMGYLPMSREEVGLLGSPRKNAQPAETKHQ